MKEFSLDFAGGEGPVANGVAVLEDDGPEDAVAAVGAVHVVGLHGQVAEEVRPDDAAAVVVLLEGPGAGTPGAHAYCPAHHLVLLRLHGPHPRHDIVGRGELRTDELLVQQALGDGVHISRK